MSQRLIRQRRFWRVAELIATMLFVAVVPLFLVAASVKWVVNSELLYTYGFDKYDIVDRTGIERDELHSAARQMREYFNDDDELITISVIKDGVPVQNLYGEREVLHMKDVKGLIRGVYRVKLLAGAYLLGFALVGLLIGRWSYLPRLAKSVGRGGLVTLALVVIVGVGALFGFERLFLEFHYLSFSNDLWILDPNRDYLIMMFPEAFFFDATMWVAGLIVLKALLLAVLTLGVFRWQTTSAEM